MQEYDIKAGLGRMGAMVEDGPPGVMSLLRCGDGGEDEVLMKSQCGSYRLRVSAGKHHGLFWSRK